MKTFKDSMMLIMAAQVETAIKEAASIQERNGMTLSPLEFSQLVHHRLDMNK